METPVTHTPPVSAAPTLWNSVTPIRCEPSPLRGDHSADVVIVGAGFLGLSAALTLAELGADVAVIDAATVGWGASGRNNGLLAPGLKRDPWEVRQLLPREKADALLRFSSAAPQRVADRVNKYDIDCDLNQAGWIQAAHAPAAMSRIRRRIEDWQSMGAVIGRIDTADLETKLGTDFFVGASLDSRGGSLNPLAYARGLADAAVSLGVNLFEHSPVVRMQRNSGRWQLETPHGRLSGDQVLLCVNAYNREFDAVCGTVIPIRTAQVASAPLADDLAERILPGGESASDTHRLLTSFRITRDRRLVMGGASATAGDDDARLAKRLQRRASRLFPYLGDIEWQFAWSGFLAITADHLPKIFDLGPGCMAATACNGRGIAMSTATGELLGDLVIGRQRVRSPIPIETPARQWRYNFREPGVAASVVASRLMDSAERLVGGLSVSD
ncbi:MAG: FAD-binding oxidoreductase [Pseudomonadota bacterium]